MYENYDDYYDWTGNGIDWGAEDPNYGSGGGGNDVPDWYWDFFEPDPTGGYDPWWNTTGGGYGGDQPGPDAGYEPDPFVWWSTTGQGDPWAPVDGPGYSGPAILAPDAYDPGSGSGSAGSGSSGSFWQKLGGILFGNGPTGRPSSGGSGGFGGSGSLPGVPRTGSGSYYPAPAQQPNSTGLLLLIVVAVLLLRK